jgi:hypothetical protein
MPIERASATAVDQLLSAMNVARGELEAFIASTPPEQLVTLRKDGWTIKDHLFHLATWDLYLIALLDRQPRLPALGIEADPRGSFDEVNAIFFERGNALPLNHVLGAFRGNRARIIEQVRKLSDADLERPAAEFQPNDLTPPQGALRTWILAVTAEHDREHHAWMRDVLAIGIAGAVMPVRA